MLFSIIKVTSFANLSMLLDIPPRPAKKLQPNNSYLRSKALEDNIEWNLNGKAIRTTPPHNNNFTFLINNTTTEIYKSKDPHKIN